MGEKKTVLYPVLSGGFSDDYPWGSQNPQAETPPFRDMQNMIFSQGVLKPAWEWTPLDDTTYTNPVIEGNIASRFETLNTNEQIVVGGALISTSSINQRAHIVITDGEIFVNGQAMNPVTSFTTPSNSFFQFGAPVSLGGGLYSYELFVGIDPDSFRAKVGDVVRAFTVEGNFGSSGWLPISSIGSESFMVVSSNASIEGSVYTASPLVEARHTFSRGSTPGKVTWCILNGDLYVACKGAGIDPSGNTSGWCVLKVADIFNTPTEAEYILSTWDVTGALADSNIVAGIDEIIGIQATAEGRLILATKEDGLGNRIRWSDHLDLTDWTSENAGFTDLATGTAEIRCFSRIGERMVAYFADSIHVGEPTFQQHLPYSFHKSRAMIGTRWYRAACEAPYGNLFVGSDGHFYAFDGDTATLLTDNTIRKYTSGPDQLYLTGETEEPTAWTATASWVTGTVVVA